MSYNGSGTFNINSGGQPVVTGTVISSTAFNALTSDLGTGLSTAITKDGQTATTTRIPFAAGIRTTLVTDSTSITTGSLICDGGAGVAKAIYGGTTMNIAGAVTFQSTLALTGTLTYGGITLTASVTGTGAMVLATSPALVTPNIGVPTAGTLTSCTGLPISTGVSGLGTGVATFLATPSSANLAAAVTGETGTGALVFATSPALVTPDIGTPTAGTLTSCTGLPISTGVSGLGTGVATFLATPSSANLAAAVTDETGTGALVFATSPTIVTPTVTTSAVIPLVNGGTAVSSTLTLQSTSGAGSSDAIVFKTASQSERMRILTTGEVGIGTASPGGKLEVVGGRSLFNAASEPFGVGARYISTGGAVYFGATNGTATPDVQISGAGGNALMTLLNGGSVGIGTTSPATSALLDLTSTTGALLLTRMTTAQRDALTAANGMVLYNTTTATIQGYQSGAWANL